jgi:transposase
VCYSCAYISSVDAAVVDLGQVRGLALFRAKAARIRHIAGNTFFVPSSTGAGGYTVDAIKGVCSCPAHEENGVRCKHLFALAYHRRELAPPSVESAVPKVVRLTYAQDWKNYNRSQCEEKEVAQILLRGLCDGIFQPKQTMGRPRMPLRDVVYGATMKVYGTMSGRRSTTDIKACAANGHVKCAPAYNTIFKYMDQPGLLPLLKTLIEESAAPFKAIERDFAADATGFATQTYVRWFDHKHGEDQRARRWVKCHAMIGVLTNIITAVHVTEAVGPGTGDSPNFADLVERTAANGFDMRDVSADKAYLSNANLAAVERVGAVPYIPFKSNSGSAGSDAWNRMYHLYSLNQDAFLAHYHKRSNVESTFSAMKRKFGAGVRSKLTVAQFNEVLLKCLCFNLSMLVHSIRELGIEPKFWMPKEAST